MFDLKITQGVDTLEPLENISRVRERPVSQRKAHLIILGSPSDQSPDRVTGVSQLTAQRPYQTDISPKADEGAANE
jgi:hypothetical protein